MSEILTLRHAAREAERCLQCSDAPCTAACPAHIDIPRFIWSLGTGNVAGAAEVVKTANALANVCGKVCPEEVFCQAVCTRAKQDSPVAIRELHGFATREEYRRGYSIPRPFPGTGKRAAVIGGGPAGLACAFELAKLGHRTTVFDRNRPGGVPRSSIPSFRLTIDEVESDVQFLSQYFDFTEGEIDSRKFNQIRADHDAVFLAVGLGVDKPVPVPGSGLPGVYSVLRFLEDAKTPTTTRPPGKRVVIVGGGNVSLDAAATAKRLGASDVTLIYRRGEQEMRIWKSELTEARGQGVAIAFLTTPVEIVGGAHVEGVRCRRTRLVEPRDTDGRRTPVEIPGSDFLIEADAVIVAIGQTPGTDFLGLFEKTPRGYVNVDAEFRTSLPSVFAGGDLVGGEGTIVQSVAQGKLAAEAIHRHLTAAAPGRKG